MKNIDDLNILPEADHLRHTCKKAYLENNQDKIGEVADAILDAARNGKGSAQVDFVIDPVLERLLKEKGYTIQRNLNVSRKSTSIYLF